MREIRINNHLGFAAVALGVFASSFGMTPLGAWPAFGAGFAAMMLGVYARDRSESLAGREGHTLGSWGAVFGLVGIGMAAIGLLSR